MQSLKTRIFFSSVLLAFGSSVVQAGGSIGVDYFDSEVSVTEISGRTAVLHSSSPGVSFGWDLSDRWSLSLNYSNGDGDGAALGGDTFTRDIFVSSESSSAGMRFSYFSEAFWVNFGASLSDDEQSVQAINPLTNNVTRDTDETQNSNYYGIELGRDWNLGNWSPSLSISLDHQSVDIDRTINIGSSLDLQEELSGTDISFIASIYYYQELSQNLLLAPSVGIYHQMNLDGEISGTAQFSGRNSVDVPQNPRLYRSNLDNEEQTSANLSINLLAGDWVWSAGTYKNLSSEVTDKSWFAALSYNF